jgi:hypothetical protein
MNMKNRYLALIAVLALLVGCRPPSTSPQVPLRTGPLDIVRVLFNKTQLAGANVTIVDGGSGTPTLGIIIAANVGASGSGYIDAQLNAAGTHWTLLGSGSQ